MPKFSIFKGRFSLASVFSTILIIAALAGFITFKDHLKKILIKNYATVFSDTIAGNWNNPPTWGITDTSSFSSPIDLTVSTSGLIYIADWGLDKILILNPANWSLVSSTTVSMNNPFDVAISTSGKLYIVVNGSDKVTVLNPNLTFFAEIDAESVPFVSPRGI